MIVRVADNIATITTPDGALHRVPFEAIDEPGMILQARYHQFLRGHQWRRKLRCARCNEDMEPEQALNDEDQTWELLMVCRCRAIYGKIPLSKLP
jgi:hypothetical protein